MLNLGDRVSPKSGYTGNKQMFYIETIKNEPSKPYIEYKLKRIPQKLNPVYGTYEEQLKDIETVERLDWRECELEVLDKIIYKPDKPQEIKVSGKNLFDNGELIYNYYKNIKEDNKIMKILELYKERKEEAIVKDFEKKEEAILAEDEIQKIIKEMVHQVNSIFENEAREDRLYIDSKNFCQEKTMDKLDELDEEKEDEILQLNKTVEEIEALFDLTEDYEERMKILKKYDIINKDGKMSL